MVAEWYCEIEGQEQGPLTAVQLKQLATSGKLQPAHSIWKQGMHKKVPARAVKGLFDAGGDGAAKKTGVATGPAAGVKPATKEEEIVETELEEVVETEHIDEVVEELEAVEEPPAPELIAEVMAVYREGIPKLDGPITGQLHLETTGLCFVFEEEEESEEIRIPFAKVDNVLEPAKGDFPPAMKSKALKAKVAGKAGKFAAGLVGNWMGGAAGDVTSKLGKAAAGAAESSGDLGKPPRNRLTVLAHVRKKRCKIYFDMTGDTREEMEEEAKHFYKKIQKARDKSSVAQQQPGAANINILAVSSGGAGGGGPSRGTGSAPAPPTAGKPFRLLCGGNIQGPFSLEELRRLLGAGKVGAGDMIGVESWVPAATLAGLLGGTGAAPGRVGAAGPAGKAAAEAGEGESDEEEEEATEDDQDEAPEMDVEPEEEEEPAEEESKSPAVADGDAPIPMDEDFNL